MLSFNVQVYYLLGVYVVLYGYVYDFQVINFLFGYLVMIVFGNGGDNFDVVLFDLFLVGLMFVLGIVIEWLLYNNSFGFLIMECNVVLVMGWVFYVYLVVGKLFVLCNQLGMMFVCDKMGFIVL